MPFELTDEQRQLRDDVRAFTDSEIRPRAIDLDRAHEYPADVLAELGDRRFTGLTLPEQYGGRGDGLVELAVVTEELAAGLMSVASSLALHLGVATVVERFGTDAQREAFLPEMASFDRVGALGLTEPNAGSDTLAMETTAKPADGSVDDADEWVIDGEKAWVTNFPNADEVLTYAKTGPAGDAPHDVTAFLVPTSEFAIEDERETLGAWSAPSPRVSLSGVRVPDDRRVGDVGEAYVQRGRVHTGVNVPARGVGIARAALDDTVAYTRDRRQFGQRIADFQGLRWQVAEMAERVDAARLLTLRAAARADRAAEPDTDRPPDGRREMAMAKVYATEAAVENASDAVQLHGGVGYTTDHHVERYLRDAKLLTIAGGPNAGHRDTLADAVFDR